jgi:hypothetical protein
VTTYLLEASAYDVIFDVARKAIAELGELASVVEETSSWSYMHDRDLTGFIDGTENPTLIDAPELALIAEGSPGAGGTILLSYATTRRRYVSTGTGVLPATATPPRELTAEGQPQRSVIHVRAERPERSHQQASAALRPLSDRLNFRPTWTRRVGLRNKRRGSRGETASFAMPAVPGSIPGRAPSSRSS